MKPFFAHRPGWSVCTLLSIVLVTAVYLRLFWVASLLSATTEQAIVFSAAFSTNTDIICRYDPTKTSPADREQARHRLLAMGIGTFNSETGRRSRINAQDPIPCDQHLLFDIDPIIQRVGHLRLEEMMLLNAGIFSTIFSLIAAFMLARRAQ